MGCLESIVIDGRPFKLMQGKGIQRMIGPIAEEFDRVQAPISTGSEYLQKKGLQAQGIIKKKIKSELRGKLVSLQLDLTTHLNRCIFGVNTQYYVDDQLKVKTLLMKRLPDNTTGVNLAKGIENTLYDYALDIDNIYTITTDNGANVLACTKILRIMQERRLEEFVSTQNIDSVNMEAVIALIDIEAERIQRGQPLHFIHQIHCAAHVLNLVIGDVLGTSDMETFLKICRDLVKILRRPTIMNLLKKKGFKMPIIDCDVRWSSVYNMVSAFHHILCV